MIRQTILAAVPLLLLACAPEAPMSEDAPRGRIGKADVIGSCIDSCDAQSLDGNCWCDSKCAEYGDCCDDVAEVCELSTCTLTHDGQSIGCDDGETCAIGVCPAFCLPDDPDCCAPNSCVPVDEPDCPNIMPPPPDSCPEGEIPSPNIGANGCVNGFECVPVASNACEDNGGFCTMGIGICPADTTATDDSCGDLPAGSFCCKAFTINPPPPPPADLSCEGVCGDFAGDKECFCDDLCTQYGDCCGDYADMCS